jgi:hypothetical protein
MLRIFFQRHNFALNAPDLGEKAGQKRPVAPKNRGILATGACPVFLALSSADHRIFRRRAQTGNRFRSKGLKNYLIYTDNEAVAKVL